MAVSRTRRNPNNHAIVYARYSSHAQNEASIEQQFEAADAYAAAHGYQIVKRYEDRALSGTDENRPGFQLMLSEVATLKPSVCLLYKTDRLARDRVTSGNAKQALREAGCAVEYVKEAMPDEGTPEFSLMEGMFESFAEFYSRQLSQNIKRGIQYNAERGLYCGRKVLGYGVDDDKRYVIDPDTAPVVRRIFELYANGHGMKEIADLLNADGLKTSQGNSFTINGIRSIIHNRAYIGEYYYSGHTIPGGMPAIVDEALFAKAHARLKLNKRGSVRRARTAESEEVPPCYWLTGKLFCGECGCGMRGTHGTSKTGAKHYYYACAEHQRHRCGKRNVRKADVEQSVKALLRFILDDDEALASLAVDASAYYAKSKDNSAYVDSLDSSLREVQAGLDNLVKAIEHGIFSESTQARLTELEDQKRTLTEAIRVERAKAAMAEQERSIAEYFQRYAHANLDDPEVRDALLDYFIDKIYLYDDHLTVVGWFADGARYDFGMRGDDMDVEFEFEPYAPFSTT